MSIDIMSQGVTPYTYLILDYIVTFSQTMWQTHSGHLQKQPIILIPVAQDQMHCSFLLAEMYYFIVPDCSERLENIKQSVERAKEAVSCDVKDGTSWCKYQLF